MRGLLNLLIVFLQNYLPIKTVVYLNIIQGEDVTLFSHIHIHKQRTYSWRRKCQGTDALQKMLPEPGICPHSARKTGWQWWRDISELKESSYSLFCVANGSRKQIDKNDPVTLGLLSINITGAWKTMSSWMTGDITPPPLHPSSPLWPHTVCRASCKWGLPATSVRQGWCPQVTPRPFRVSKGAVLADFSIGKLHIHQCLPHQSPSVCLKHWRA